MASSPFPTCIFGTFENGNSPESMEENVAEALRAGFRTFDLAEHYESQFFAGRAIQAAGLARSDVFLINKLDGMPSGAYEAIKARVEALLLKVGVDYFDALLIHYPLPGGADLSGDPDALVPPGAWEHFVATIEEAWKNMSRLRADGLVRECGVSNFYRQHLDQLARVLNGPGSSTKTPGDDVENDVDMAPLFAVEAFVDPCHPEDELAEWCADHSSTTGLPCHLLAYRPLAFAAVHGLVEELGAQQVAAAEAAGCDSVQQLALVWLLARGLSPICSSGNSEHIQSNWAARRVGVDVGGHRLLSPGPVAATFEAAKAASSMVDEMGGLDEYAAAFKTKMGPAAE